MSRAIGDRPGGLDMAPAGELDNGMAPPSRGPGLPFDRSVVGTSDAVAERRQDAEKAWRVTVAAAARVAAT